MGHQLESAANRLAVALDQYLEAGRAMQKACAEHGRMMGSCQAHAAANQLQLASRFEEKISRAKAASGFARNRSSSTVPIHSLAENLLARIFYYFVISEKCETDPFSRKFYKLPKHPIYLTHVCAYWRRIAMESPHLWSHIDISPLLLKGEKSFPRIQAFLLRAAQSPLDLHIHHMRGDDGSPHEVDPTLVEYIIPLIPRMRGLVCDLDLAISRHDPSTPISAQDFCLSMLSRLWNMNAAPGAFSLLELTNRELDVFYIQPSELPQHGGTISLDIPSQHFEDLLLPISVLKLTNIFPHWTSKAFHGLVDLRLCTYNDSVNIHESQLVAILAHSPSLRVLELGIDIDLANTLLMPVALYNLEALTTHLLSSLKLGRFLRLLDTGSNPLFVSIDAANMVIDEGFDENIVHFFCRSNVTRLCTEQVYEFCKSIKFASLTHTIKKLALIPPSNDPWSFHSDPGSPIQVRLDTLYLLGAFELDINGLRGAVDWSSVQKLVVWGQCYQVTCGGRPIVNKEFLKKELSKLGVAVDILSSDMPSPINSFLL